MKDQEAVQMMRRASEEIKTLRAQIAYLQPKADAYDSVATVLRLLPAPSTGYGEDVAWLLDKRIREIEAAGNSSVVASTDAAS